MTASAGGMLAPEGALTFESLPSVLAQAEAFAARPDLPARLDIDFARVTAVDSAALALLLEWRRVAARRGTQLTFLNLPPNLVALAALYGIEQLVQPAA